MAFLLCLTRRRAFAATLATVGATAIAAFAPGVAAADTVLVGRVAPGVSLTDASGAPVMHLDPGTFTVVVHDLSTQDNFHLYGPGGIDLSTEVPFQGDVTWTVALVAGRYYFKSDVRNENQLYAFDVGTVPSVATTTAAKPLAKPVAKPKPAAKQPVVRKPVAKKAAAPPRR